MKTERYENLAEALRDSIIAYKELPATIEMNRGREVRRLSYLDFAREAACVIGHLKAVGIHANDRVAIVMSNQSRWLIGAYAVFLRGAVLVPIDYKLSVDEQAELIKHSKASLLITEFPVWRSLVTRLALPSIVSELPKESNYPNVVGWDDLPEAPLDFSECSNAKRDDIATIVYSSGTSGNVKGCMLSHGAYLAQYAALSEMFPLEEGHRYFSILPTNHAIDFMCGFLGPFFGGATVVHQRTLRPEFIMATMKQCQITHMAVVPMLLQAFERAINEKLESASKVKQRIVAGLSKVNQALTRNGPKQKLSRLLLRPIHEPFGGRLEVLFCGGAPVDAASAAFFYRLGIPVAIGYGLTEACTVLTVNDLKPFRANTVGRPVPGVQIRVACPGPDGVGEVHVAGPTLMRGYLDNADLSAEVLCDGWLKTGDLGYLDKDGHLHLVGRCKNMIVTAGGKNVYPEDVESAFRDTPCDELAVMASAFVWRSQDLKHDALIAVVRTQKEREVLLQDIVSRNRSLPEHKRVGGVLFWQESFPRTASLKLKRDLLAEQLREKTKHTQIASVS